MVCFESLFVRLLVLRRFDFDLGCEAGLMLGSSSFTAFYYLKGREDMGLLTGK